MDKVGGRAEIGGKFRVIFDRFKRSRRAETRLRALGIPRKLRELGHASALLRRCNTEQNTGRGRQVYWQAVQVNKSAAARPSFKARC